MKGGAIAAVGVLLLCCCVLVLVMGFGVSTGGSKKSTSPESNSNSEDDVLVITEDGASRQDGGGASTTETYMILNDAAQCRQENPAPWCDKVGYDQTTDGLTFFYDLDFDPKGGQFPSECEGGKCSLKVGCPDGEFDCAYVEKFNSEGSLVGIVNKRGEHFLDRLAEDIWAGKLNGWDFASRIQKDIKYEDGKLIFNKDIGPEDIKEGDELSLKWAIPKGAATIYFVVLLNSMKQAGEKRPTKIVLDVAGARDAFVKRTTPTEGEKESKFSKEHDA